MLIKKDILCMEPITILLMKFKECNGFIFFTTPVSNAKPREFSWPRRVLEALKIDEESGSELLGKEYQVLMK